MLFVEVGKKRGVAPDFHWLTKYNPTSVTSSGTDEKKEELGDPVAISIHIISIILLLINS